MDHASPQRRQPVRISYPDPSNGSEPIAAIAARNNLPLLIGDDLVAEVSSNHFQQGWKSASRLSDEELAICCQAAAKHLSEAFRNGIETADLPELVADAAVLFLLSLKKHGIAIPAGLKPCTVTHDGELAAGTVSI